MSNNQQLPKATHEGILPLGQTTLNVAVLDGEKRVISQSAIYKAFGRTQRGRGKNDIRALNMPAFIDAKNLQPFIEEDLKAKLNQIEYIAKNGKIERAYDALILPKLCKVYLDARAQGMLADSQEPLARASEVLLVGLSHIGIIALVDEVTGYQDIRVKDALQQILDKYLLDEAKKYQVTFPLDLYKQWFRLNGWEWKPENAQKRPGVIGKWTNEYIYSRMAPGLLKELNNKNPKNSRGNREHKHFQLLTDDIGEPRLREFFGGLIALAKASTTWRKYTELIERAYPAIGDQFRLELDPEKE